ncbi:MAG: hypothetical protein ABIJ46_02010, partial [bacterium]
MKKILFGLLLIACVALPTVAQAQNAPTDDERVFRAVVEEVVDETRQVRENGTEAVGQVLRLRGLDDEHEGFEFTFDGTQYDELAAGVYRPGDRVF